MIFVYISIRIPSSSSYSSHLSLHNIAMNSENKTSFDMDTLKTNLPLNRKGLSRYYSGKSRSFTCMEEVHSVEDLKKLEHSDAKKRKKYSERNKELLDNVITSYPCRRISSTNQCGPPCVGV